MHLRILPDHQKFFFRKNIFDRLEWFDAFSHTSRSPETFFQKRYFLPSGVVKNVFSEFFFKKDIFDRLEWLKNVFWCIFA
jgi:hypothetical protein